MLKQILFSQIRHAVTIAAGALVTHGLTSDSGAQQFIGAVMALAGLAWSIADKYLRARFPGATAQTSVPATGAPQPTTATTNSK